MSQNNHQPAEKMVLRHQPVPGYKTALYLTVALGLAYLLLVFTKMVGP